MKCFEIDFNNPRWFTAADVDTGDINGMEKEDLPQIGEEVFVYNAEMKSFPTRRPTSSIFDIGFGFVTRVTDVYESQVTKGSYVIKFENTYKREQ